MAFKATNFVYNDIPSEMYNLTISGIDTGESANMGSGTVEFAESYLWRRERPFFYSTALNSKLELPISVFSEDEIDALTASYVLSWLFGQLEYKRLSIIESDFDEVYFETIFTDPSILRSGNVIYGFSGTAICSSQFGLTYPTTNIYNYTDVPVNSQIVFYNNSHYAGYLRPSLDFTMNSSGGDFSIVNNQDSSRRFEFTDLYPGEVITVNNDLQIVSSSTGIVRLSNFNKNFFRLVPGINVLDIDGNVAQIRLTYQFYRRLGG